MNENQFDKWSINPFFWVYFDIMERGYESAPRGQSITEIENYHMMLRPITDRFTSFKTRKINLDYMKFEMCWYLRGDRYETDLISEKAQIWKDIIDTDGGINSNYGQYLFRSLPTGGIPPKDPQFKYVIDTLREDKDSRRAVMTLLHYNHLRTDNKDVVCTYYIAFRIRQNKLNMTIGMRAWDAIWGMTNDVFCFSVIYELMYNLLLEFYPDLKIGSYYHHADSIHIYERHYKMVAKMLGNGFEKENYPIECPRISGPAEARFLIDRRMTSNIALILELEQYDSYKFSKWLYS